MSAGRSYIPEASGVETMPMRVLDEAAPGATGDKTAVHRRPERADHPLPIASAAGGPNGKSLQPAMSNDTRRNDKDGEDHGTGVVTKTRPKTKRPSMYRVLLLNDDYTPMEFVVHVLERFFNKTRDEATQIMLHVHHHGVGECGIYTYEVAETKVTQVMDFARRHQHPLQCVMEKK